MLSGKTSTLWVLMERNKVFKVGVMDSDFMFSLNIYIEKETKNELFTCTSNIDAKRRC